MDDMEARGISSSADGHGCVLTVYDLGTGYLMGYPIAVQGCTLHPGISVSDLEADTR